MKLPTFLLQIRSYPGDSFKTVWLIRRDGPVDAAVLWGNLTPELVDELILGLGLPVESDSSPFEVRPHLPPGCKKISEQEELTA